MSVLKGWLLKNLRINQEDLLQNVQKIEGNSSINRVIDDVVILIEELLHQV